MLCLLSVLSARIPLFLFSEMKTHGEGCAIVRPGCHVFFFCLLYILAFFLLYLFISSFYIDILPYL